MEAVGHVETETLRGELGIQMIAKPEVNLPFSSSFEFIGARFDASNLENPTHRPAYHILERLRDEVLWLFIQKVLPIPIAPSARGHRKGFLLLTIHTAWQIAIEFVFLHCGYGQVHVLQAPYYGICGDG